MIHFDGRKECRCIFCSQTFSIDKVSWIIDRERAAELNDNSAQMSVPRYTEDPLGDAMDRFLRADAVGATFYGIMSGQIKPGESARANDIRIVRAEDLTPDAERNGQSPNIYRTLSGERIRIFNPFDMEKDGAVLHLSDEFLAEMDKRGYTGFQQELMLRHFEEKCVRPVCPKCSSYLPREIFNTSSGKDVYVARLAFIGPVESGKTTLIWTNLMCKLFDRGGWFQDTDEVFATTHYMAKNFYEHSIRYKILPQRTQRNVYVPPLLLRLQRNGITLILLLMDVAGELLQTIKEARESGALDPQMSVYAKLIQSMDGFLLMLDSKREIRRRADKLAGNSVKNPANDPSPLSDLVRACGVYRKPAALLITKCDDIMENLDSQSILNRQYKKLFSDFSETELSFWQQPVKGAVPYMDNITDNIMDTPYSADYHECIQMSFKPFVRKHFPQLWRQLEQTFSRVDVFPEASLGSELPSDTPIEREDIHPFFSVDPIFWLLDMISPDNSDNSNNFSDDSGHT